MTGKLRPIPPSNFQIVQWLWGYSEFTNIHTKQAEKICLPMAGIKDSKLYV